MTDMYFFQINKIPTWIPDLLFIDLLRQLFYRRFKNRDHRERPQGAKIE
jgi:hypothetical protein